MYCHVLTMYDRCFRWDEIKANRELINEHAQSSSKRQFSFNTLFCTQICVNVFPRYTTSIHGFQFNLSILGVPSGAGWYLSGSPLNQFPERSRANSVVSRCAILRQHFHFRIDPPEIWAKGHRPQSLIGTSMSLSHSLYVKTTPRSSGQNMGRLEIISKSQKLKVRAV